MRAFIFCSVYMLLASGLLAAPEQPEILPSTQRLSRQGDFSTQMVAGIDTFLMRELDYSVAERLKLWNRDCSSAAAYEKSIQPNRERFRKMIGAVDPRLPV